MNKIVSGAYSFQMEWWDENGVKRAVCGASSLSENAEGMTSNQVEGLVAHQIARMIARESADAEGEKVTELRNDGIGWGILPKDVSIVENVTDFYESGMMFHKDGLWRDRP